MRFPVELSKDATLSKMSFAPLAFYFTDFVNVTLSTAVQRTSWVVEQHVSFAVQRAV